MTIFGPDISSYQNGLNLASLADAAFVIAKTTEGTYYTDADYDGWRLQAGVLHKPFVWYHFLSGESAADQAAHTLAHVGDKSLPGMLDAEPAGSFSPTLAQILAYIDAAHAAKLNLRLCYLPHWYWQRMGSPDLSGLTARGVQLVSSAYPGGSGSPAAIYPGDGAAGWQSYGGMTPLIYQFTNQATDAGKPLDYNAFKGTAADLVAAFNPAATGEPEMTPQEKTDLVDEIVAAVVAKLPAAVYRYGEEDVTIGGNVTHNTPFGHEAHGAWFSTNDPDGPVLKAIADLKLAVVATKHELDAVTTALGKTVTP